MATFLSMTKASKEEHMSLEWVQCIYYPLRFRKDIVGIKALIDPSSEVNAMTPAYISKLGLKVHHTNVGARKVHGSTLGTFGIVLANF